MSVYAQLEDIEEHQGHPVPVEQAHNFQHLLDEAEVELGVVGGDLADRIAAGLTTAARLKLAAVEMVLRAWRDTTIRSQLMAGTTGEERAQAGAWLQAPGEQRWVRVTRRERWLLGMASSAVSLSLSDADTTLVCPVVSDVWPSRGSCRYPSY
jgi:hypothetical protein